MKGRTFKKASLLFSTALGAVFMAGGAMAQQASNTAANSNQGDNGTQIQEIIVTATRQAQNVNTVPVAVTAETQRNLDQQGVLRINDLASIVPGFRVNNQEASGNVNIALRGVVQTTGAATTGFYLDEAPLQKRNGSGFGSQNGTPIPAMFDLDRIEVLRGPQGTLFGGGSEGGTIRYIQAQPSLTHYSTYARAQYSGNAYGDPSYEAGAAVGGPIIPDKLGFRASLYGRQTGGFIDLSSPYDGHVITKNSNSGDEAGARLALTWAPTNFWTITASFFASENESKNNTTSFNLSVPGTLTVPTSCFAPAIFAGLPLSGATQLARSAPGPIFTGPACSAIPSFVAAAQGLYQRPGYTLGPLNLSKYQELGIGPVPTATQLQVSTVNMKFELPHDLTFVSNTSYVVDFQSSAQPQTFEISTQQYPKTSVLPTYTAPGMAPIALASGVPYNPYVSASVNSYPGNFFVANTHNQRHSFAQEFRLTSAPNQSPVSFVVGAYFNNSQHHINELASLNSQGFMQLNGMTMPQEFGVPDVPFYASVNELETDTEAAVYGEATWHVNDKLNVLGGLRVTHLVSTFDQNTFGPINYTLTPSIANGSRVIGTIIDDPVTPKFSVQYSLAPRDILYATAAKGFRAGGINPVLSPLGLILLQLQYGVTDYSILPKFYKSDSVWSYEIGGKFSLWDGRAQVNIAGFLIDWDNVQVNQPIGGDSFNVNAPHAQSKGVEIETQLRPIRNLSINASAAYDHAEYTGNLSIPTANPATPIVIEKKGDVFHQPEWTASLGARYDIPINDRNRAYVRADYRWAQGYLTAVPGTPFYSPDNSYNPENRNLDMRLGLEHEGAEVNLFVLNLTDNREGLVTGGRGTCPPTGDPQCNNYGSYNPFRTTNWGRRVRSACN